MVKFFYKLFILCITIYLLSGCSVLMWWDKDPPKLIVNVTTDDKINPNIDNEPTSVSVQVIQLNSDELFNKGMFIDIYNNASDILGPTYLNSKTEESITPSSTRTIEMNLEPKTTYVAIIAGFSQYDDTNGKAILGIVNKNKDKELNLSIKGSRLELKEKE
ncbi:MAG: type VI secretion system lipoprotein TssJ [Succinivibrionaceae bacterium]